VFICVLCRLWAVSPLPRDMYTCGKLESNMRSEYLASKVYCNFSLLHVSAVQDTGDTKSSFWWWLSHHCSVNMNVFLSANIISSSDINDRMTMYDYLVRSAVFYFFAKKYSMLHLVPVMK